MGRVTKIIAAAVIVAVIAVGVVVAYVLWAYPDVGVTPTLKIERTPERLARGEYLFSAMGCKGCHTPFLEPRRYAGVVDEDRVGAGRFFGGPEQGFPGEIYAPNITPAALGNWSDGEIVQAMTSGVSRDGRPLFALMPYRDFGRLDSEDIYSVVAYLRTLPGVENEISGSRLPPPVALVVRTLPEKPRYTARPDPNDTISYGEYVSRRSGCLDCHTESLGPFRVGTPYAGGNVFEDTRRIMRSPNLTPDPETGLGTWSKEDFIARFRAMPREALVDVVVDPTDLDTPMPWWELNVLTDQDLSALYDFLMSLEPVSNPVVRFEIKSD